MHGLSNICSMDCIVVRILTVVIFLNHNCTHTDKKKRRNFYSPRGTSKYWKVVIMRDPQTLSMWLPTQTVHILRDSLQLSQSPGILIPCHSREHAKKSIAARPVAVWPVTHAVCHWPKCCYVMCSSRLVWSWIVCSSYTSSRTILFSNGLQSLT